MVTNNRHGFSAASLQRLDDFFQGYVDARKLAGVVTLITQADEIVQQGVYGLRDMATNVPMEPDTIFRIYSMTKPITSLGLMMLYEQGRVNLDDPLVKFLPEFEALRVQEDDGKLSAPRKPITILDLLRHTAGFSYGRYRDTEDPIDQLYDEADLFNLEQSLEEMMLRLSMLPLKYHPGEDWYYSVATDVLGRVIEVVSGSSLSDFFAEQIFRPLRMKDTAFKLSPKKMDRLASLYGRSRSQVIKPLDDSIGGDYLNPRLHLGGQGLASTATDYLQFAQLMLNKGEWQGTRLLERKTVELMIRNHIPPDHLPISYNGIVDAIVPGIGFGLGFNVILDPAEADIRGRRGDYGWAGYAETYFWISPQEQLIAILMTQLMPSLHYPIRNEFRTLVYEALEE